jgi:hypothetical protein
MPAHNQRAELTFFLAERNQRGARKQANALITAPPAKQDLHLAAQ